MLRYRQGCKRCTKVSRLSPLNFKNIVRFVIFQKYLALNKTKLLTFSSDNRPNLTQRLHPWVQMTILHVKTCLILCFIYIQNHIKNSIVWLCTVTVIWFELLRNLRIFMIYSFSFENIHAFLQRHIKKINHIISFNCIKNSRSFFILTRLSQLANEYWAISLLP